MDRTIQVIGKSKLSVRPDVTRLILSLEGLEKEYDAVLKLSSKDTETLKGVFEKFGFERKDLKTRYFNVDTHYESYQAKDKSWKQRFKGYRYSHKIVVEFPSDNEKLGKILYALGHCEISPEIKIEDTVSNPEAAKNELLAKAVADSKAKAVVLAEAGGVTLGEIVTIDYSFNDIGILSKMSRTWKNESVFFSAANSAVEKLDINIEPEDIELSDSVKVVWKIN